MFTRPRTGLVDFIGAALCLWGAAYHTPAGALLRDLVARVTRAQTHTRPLLAYYSGGLYDARETALPVATTNPLPDETVLVSVPYGQALARGVYAVIVQLEAPERAACVSVAQRYHEDLSTPESVGRAIENARAELKTDEAAVLALFVGFDVARYAASRAIAEGARGDVFGALVRQLPPTQTQQALRASNALTLGTAYALGWPVPPGTRVSSPFGYRFHPILGREQLHTGVDLALSEGTPVKAVAAGRVTRASEDAVNGRIVIVDHGFGVATAYCHNSRLLVRVGQTVQPGEIISESGSTGRSTGPHMHYQLALANKPVDPFVFRGTRPRATTESSGVE